MYKCRNKAHRGRKEIRGSKLSIESIPTKENVLIKVEMMGHGSDLVNMIVKTMFEAKDQGRDIRLILGDAIEVFDKIKKEEMQEARARKATKKNKMKKPALEIYMHGERIV